MDLPIWLILLAAGLLLAFLIFNFFKYRKKDTKMLLSADTRKEILLIILILIGVGIVIPQIIKFLF